MNFKIFLHKYLTPRHGLTKLVGHIASAKLGPALPLVIKLFAKANNIDLSLAKEPIINFKTFNEFFIRDLKDGLRPIGSHNIVSPSEGKVTQFGRITDCQQLIQAKGQYYSLQQLLGISSTEAKKYKNGSFFTIYLSPKDYHKVHMPCTGTLTKAVFIPGDLYSVNDNAINNIEALYARNERMVCYFDTKYGEMIQILIGATITGSIHTVWQDAIKSQHSNSIIEKDYTNLAEPIVLEKGQYMGAFLMGSTTINIFTQALDFDANIVPDATILVNANLANVAEITKTTTNKSKTAD